MGPYRKEMLPDGASLDYGPLGLRMCEPCQYDANQVRRDRLTYRRAHLEQAESALRQFRHAGSALDQGATLMQFAAPRWDSGFGEPPVDEHGETTLPLIIARLVVVVKLRKAALAREEYSGKSHPAERELPHARAELKAAREMQRRLDSDASTESVWSYVLQHSLRPAPAEMTREAARSRVTYLLRIRGERVVRLERELQELPAPPEKEEVAV
jgi:hypothetical protein